MKIAIVALVMVTSCAEESVSPEPTGDYTTWKKVETWGDVPGHGDTYRIIYANELAQQFTGGQYPEGSVLVKEIHDYVDGTPGDLREVNIMRRIGLAPAALDDEAGWLFTETDRPGGAESHDDYCWSHCHVVAPYAGAWFDYSRAE